MAQEASTSGIALNALTVSGKKNECSIASARSNCCCASGVQEVLKNTRPNFSALGLARSSWARATGANALAIRLAATIDRMGFMSALPSVWLEKGLLAEYRGLQRQTVAQVRVKIFKVVEFFAADRRRLGAQHVVAEH